MYKNQKVALLATTTGIVCSLIFAYTVYYLRYSAQLNFKEWDMDTVTTADFTVQINITEKIWKKW